jgi:hypothetical protein
MKISRQDLVNILATTDVESVEVQSLSVAKMNKRNNPLKDERVTKRTTIVYGFGKSYEDRVNEALVESEKEATFKSGSLKWGSWVEGAEGKVIQHTKDGEDKLYVRCYLIDESNNATTEYYVNGKVATESELATIKEFLPSRTKDCSTQKDVGLESTKQVVVNAVDFSNIVWIKIGNETYELN